MDANKSRQSAFLSGMFTVIALGSVYWFITPASHPDASTARVIAVILQGLIGTALAVWCWRRSGGGERM